jgi:hypothetical protein
MSGEKRSIAEAYSNNKDAKGHFVGKEQLMGHLVFKYNSKDQADMFLRTKKELANVVGKKYGSEMFDLVKHLKERGDTELEEPKGGKDGEVSKLALETYKVKLSNKLKKDEEYVENKHKVFVMILGQCTSQVIVKLESDEDYETLEKERDVVGLLNKLRDLAFGTKAQVHPYWAALRTTKRMFTITQGSKETNTHYAERVLAQADVLSETVGFIYPGKLVTSNANKATKEAAREQFLVMIMLDGADRNRYRPLLRELHNSYISNIDKYPKTIEATTTLLTNYQADGKLVINKEESDKSEYVDESSFAQFSKKPLGGSKTDKERKFKCPNCGKFGHYPDQCPNETVGSQHNQMEGNNDKHVHFAENDYEERISHWSGQNF